MIREVKEQEKNVGEPQTSDWKSAWDLMEKMGSSWVSCESFKISAQPNWNDLIAWSNNQSSTRSCLATSNLGYVGVVLRQWKFSKHAPILDSKLRRFTAFLPMQKWLTSLLSRTTQHPQFPFHQYGNFFNSEFNWRNIEWAAHSKWSSLSWWNFSIWKARKSAIWHGKKTFSNIFHPEDCTRTTARLTVTCVESTGFSFFHH